MHLLVDSKKQPFAPEKCVLSLWPTPEALFLPNYSAFCPYAYSHPRPTPQADGSETSA
jgi:hypothetical protein